MWLLLVSNPCGAYKLPIMHNISNRTREHWVADAAVNWCGARYGAGMVIGLAAVVVVLVLSQPSLQLSNGVFGVHVYVLLKGSRKLNSFLSGLSCSCQLLCCMHWQAFTISVVIIMLLLIFKPSTLPTSQACTRMPQCT